MPERTLVSQLKNNIATNSPTTTNSAQLSTIFHHNHHSTPSSPIPNQHQHHQHHHVISTSAAAAAAVAAGILSSSSMSSTSSNSSPPPSTIMQSSNHPNNEGNVNINYPDDSNRYVDQRRHHVMNARVLQHAVNEARMKPIIINYLSNHYSEEERTVIILTSKVAQKSYGTEKR